MTGRKTKASTPAATTRWPAPASGRSRPGPPGAGVPGAERRTYVGLVHDAEYYELTLAEAAVLAGQILALVFTAVTSPRGRRAF